MVRDEVDEKMRKLQEEDLIDDALELEMIPIRKENKETAKQGLCALAILFGLLWAFKIYLLPLLLI